jgi:hypothetical protein
MQSDYNAWFLIQLGKYHPKLFGSIEKCEHEGIYYLRATINHEDSRRIIRVSNYGCEITVTIDTHHAHFDHESKADRDNDFEEAMDWINDVLNGQVFVCSKYVGDKLVSSCSTYSSDDLAFKDGERVEVLCYPEIGVREIRSTND